MTQHRTRWMPLLVLMASLAALLVLAGCKTKLPAFSAATTSATTIPGDKVLATVNGTPITDSELTLWLEGPHGGKANPQLRAKALNELIDAELFYQKGVALGFNKDPMYERRIQAMQMRVDAMKRSEMMRQVYNREILAKVTVSDAEVQQYYDAHVKQIQTVLHLESIPFKSLDQAEKALGEIKNGQSFEKVAKETYPPIPKTATGAHKTPWDLGEVHWSRIPSNWLEPLYSLKVGEVSGVLASGTSGVRIFKVVGRKVGPKPDLQSVSQSIRSRVHNVKTQAYEVDYVRKMESKADIKRFTDNS